MSKAPSMPVFTDALIGDTTDLSIEEFGAYTMLLFVTWRNNGDPLPDDAARMARICRMSEKRWTEKIRPIVMRFFDLSEGTWRQARLEKEWNFVAKQRAKQSDKGKLSAQARALKNNDTSSTVVPVRLQPQLNPQPQPLKEEEKKEDSELKLTPENGSVVPFPATTPSKPTLRDLSRQGMEIWNLIFADKTLPQITKIEGAREKRFGARLMKDMGGDIGQFEAFCQRVRSSPFLTGSNQRGWIADFDWCLEPSHFTKIMEGRYDQRQAKPHGDERGSGFYELGRRIAAEGGFG